MAELTDDQLQRLYTWIDEIPLSRPKRNIARDFSDGVLLAEVIKHYFPTMVELHNYPAANSTQQKLYNWTTLNSKVLRKLGYNMPKEDIEAVLQCRANAVEKVLNVVQIKMAQYRARARSATPERRGHSAPGHGSVPRGSRPGSAQSGTTPRGSSASRARVPSPISSPYRRGRPGVDHSGDWRGGDGGSAAPPHHHGWEGAARGGHGGHGAAAPSGGSGGLSVGENGHNAVDARYAAALAEREAECAEHKETVGILELKVAKLEQLVRLKDAKIQKLQAAVAQSRAPAPSNFSDFSNANRA